MIPVEQTIMGGDSTMPGVHGDCLRACVASVFELPIEDVPHFVAEDDWYNHFRRWIESRGFVLGNAFHTLDEDDPTKLNGHPSEGIHWIASVYSPRLVHEDGKPGQHVVVMCGGEMVWDPHPQREMGHLGFVGIGYSFVAPDPARLELRDDDALPERPERIDDPLPEDLNRLLLDPEIAIDRDIEVHRLLRKHLRANPDATVNRYSYLNLWALYEKERLA
jgi:hypothetical protein